MKKKIENSLIEQEFAKNNLILTGIYQGALCPLSYKCTCGRINTTTWHDFCRGVRCGYCNKHRNQKYNQEEVEKIFSQYGCKLLSEYKNINEKISYECSCGNMSQTTFKAFKRGNKKCSKCSVSKGSNRYNWIVDREEAYNRNKFNMRIRYLLKNTLKRTNQQKTNKTEKMLGYTAHQLREWIESHKNWNKLKDKKWHLDHIFPIKAFLDFNIKDIAIINNLHNLQPLLGEYNLRKSDKYNVQKFKKWLCTI